MESLALYSLVTLFLIIFSVRFLTRCWLFIGRIRLHRKKKMTPEQERQVHLNCVIEMERILKTLKPEDEATTRRAIRDMLKLMNLYGEHIGYMALLYAASKARLDRK